MCGRAYGHSPPHLRPGSPAAAAEPPTLRAPDRRLPTQASAPATSQEHTLTCDYVTFPRLASDPIRQSPVTRGTPHEPARPAPPTLSARVNQAPTHFG